MGDDDLGYDGEVLGSFKTKLTETKERWAEEERGISGVAAKPGQRLPPGQQLTRDWPVLDLGTRPHVARQDWTLSVAGLVENPTTWTWDTFQHQPQETRTTDMHCVTTWSRYDNQWEGVSASRFLDVVKPKSTAKFIIFNGHDGYATNVPLDDFARADVMLAHSWNGQVIDRDHGGPVRPIIPHLYLWKSIKWLKHVLFTDKDIPGYWEARGYHRRGDPWKEERYG